MNYFKGQIIRLLRPVSGYGILGRSAFGIVESYSRKSERIYVNHVYVFSHSVWSFPSQTPYFPDEIEPLSETEIVKLRLNGMITNTQYEDAISGLSV